MANLDYKTVLEMQNRGITNASFPPGFIEGFRPTLNKELTVTVGGGVTTVENQDVVTTSTLLTRQMWQSPYTGGDAGLFYYVYLTKDGRFKVDFTRPEYSDRYYYYAHPAYGWRVILRLWMDSDEKIKFVSREYYDTPRTVTVAPNDYVGEADYYADGQNDQVWIKAAIDYADRVQLLGGTFYWAQQVTIGKDNWVLSGQGANAKIEITSSATPLVLGDGGTTTFYNNRLESLIINPHSAEIDFFSANTVYELSVANCSFGMNTGFSLTTCNFSSVTNNVFKGIENYPGGCVNVTTSRVSIETNTFQWYGATKQYKAAAINCNGCWGSIIGNNFYKSGSILLDSDSDVSMTVSGNNHEDPLLFWDEGDASYGPGVEYGSNTEDTTDVWEQATVTFTHPYDSSVTSYSAYKHTAAAADVYLSDDGGGTLGYGGESEGSVVASVYHDTGATPASTTLKLQGKVVGAWTQTGNDLNMSGAGGSALAALSSTRVAFIDYTNDDLRTYDFDGTDWAQVGNDLNISGAAAAALAALSPTRVAFIDSSNDDLRTYDFDGTDWAQVGNDLNISGVTTMALAALSSTRVAYIDDNNKDLRTYDFDGTDWAQVGNDLNISGVNNPALAALSSTRVAYIDQDNGYLRTYDFDGTDWAQVGNDLNISGVGYPALAALSSTRVAFIDSTNDDLRTYDFDGTDWSQVGNDLNISGVGSPALAALSSTRVAFMDENNDDLRTYDLSVTWTDIDTQAASANGEWEELSLDVATDADVYDGYRVLVDSSEEYYVFRAMALQDGTANVRGSCLRIPSDSSVTLSAHEDNSWQNEGNATETRITQKTKTLGAQDAGLVYVDPSDSAITVSLPTPSTGKGLTYRIVNRHYGYGLIEEGDCESTNEPILTGDNGNANDVDNATLARSDAAYHNGSYSFKFTITSTGTIAQAFLHDDTADLHGLTAGETYTATCWIYVPTSGGPLATESHLYVYDTTNSAVLADVEPSATGAWERISATFTIPATCAAIDISFNIDAAASDGEFFYVDDVQLYQHYDVTISGQIDKWTSKTLYSEGDYLEVVSDGDKYQIAGYYGHGENTDGNWEINSSGIQVCWGSLTNISPSNTANYNIGTYGWSFYYSTGATITFPKAFGSEPYVGEASNASDGSVPQFTVFYSVSTTGCSYSVRNTTTTTVATGYFAIGTAA